MYINTVNFLQIISYLLAGISFVSLVVALIVYAVKNSDESFDKKKSRRYKIFCIAAAGIAVISLAFSQLAGVGSFHTDAELKKALTSVTTDTLNLELFEPIENEEDKLIFREEDCDADSSTCVVCVVEPAGTYEKEIEEEGDFSKRISSFFASKRIKNEHGEISISPVLTERIYHFFASDYTGYILIPLGGGKELLLEYECGGRMKMCYSLLSETLSEIMR